MLKVSKAIRDIITVIAIFVLMWAIGWICDETGVSGNNPPETTKFVAQVLVIDENGTIVPNETVYAITCLQKPAGWITPAWYADNDSGYAVTDNYGFASIDSKNYTLTRNDILWIGASTDRGLLESDLVSKSFNPGNTGKWSRYNYSDVRHTQQMEISAYARQFVVRNSDGRMIDMGEFYRAYGLLFTENRLIAAFWYMDNRSWDYSV